MPPRQSDLLIACGGEELERGGVLLRKVAPIAHGGEEWQETHTRADVSTVASYLDRDGYIRRALANVPRAQWVDLDGDGVRETPGLLSEGTEDNKFSRSEEFDHADWGKVGASITANATTAPDRETTADKLVESALNEIHLVRRDTPSLSDGTRQAWSVFAKAAERTWIYLRSGDKAGTARLSWFDLSAGTTGTVDGGHVARIEKLGDGWYRCSIVWDSGSGGSTPEVLVGLATGDGNSSYLGDGASGAHIWGAQFEQNRHYPTSYIKTTTGVVTRAADALTIPFYSDPWSDGMTIWARLARPGAADATGTISTNPGVLSLGAGSTPRLGMRLLAASRSAQAIWSASADSTASAAIPSGADLAFSMQAKLFSTGAQVAIDVGSGLGAFGGAGSSATAFGAQSARIGQFDDPFDGLLIGLKIARGLWSRAEMQAL